MNEFYFNLTIYILLSIVFIMIIIMFIFSMKEQKKTEDDRIKFLCEGYLYYRIKNNKEYWYIIDNNSIEMPISEFYDENCELTSLLKEGEYYSNLIITKRGTCLIPISQLFNCA